MTITQYIKEKVPNHIVYKIIYLSAWKYTLVNNREMFDAKWNMSKYGPIALEYNDIELNDDNKQIIDFIIKVYNDLLYNRFVNLYFSTFPALTTDRFDDFDMLEKAKIYKEMVKKEDKDRYLTIIDIK